MSKRGFITLLSGTVFGALLMAVFFVSFKSCSSGSKDKVVNNLNSSTLKQGRVIDNSAHSDNEDIPDWDFGYTSKSIRGRCHLAGRIMDMDSRPLKGAVVRLRLLDEPWAKSNIDIETVTDEHGDYRFKGLASDFSYQVFSYADGFATASFQGAVCGAKTDLYLEKGAVLKLRFIDDKGEALSYVSVNIGGSALWPNRVAVSDKLGSVEFPGLSPGFYSFSAIKKSLAFTLLEPIELIAGDEIELEAQLVNVGSLKLSITDSSTGKSVSDAVVTLIPDGAPLIIKEYKSNKKGELKIDGASIGGNKLIVSAAGYLKKEMSGVMPGSAVNISLEKGGVIKGVVETAKGERIKGALINVRITSGADSYVNEQDMQTSQRQFSRRRLDSQLRGRPRSIMLKPGVMWAGPANIPVIKDEPYSVGINNNQQVIAWQPTNDNGEYLLDGLPSGELSLGAVHDRFVTFRRPSVVLSSGQKLEGIPIIMKRGVTLVLRAVSKEGHPVENAVITVFDMDGGVLKNATAKQDGYVTIDGLPGEFKLEVTAEGFVSVVRRILGAPGQTSDITVTLPDTDKRLKGVVANRQGRGLAGIRVEAVLESKGLSQVLNSITGNDGSFLIEGAADGVYQLKALVDGETRAQVSDVRPGRDVHLVIKGDIGNMSFNGVSNIASLPSPQLPKPKGFEISSFLPKAKSADSSLNAPVSLVEPGEGGAGQRYTTGTNSSSSYGETDQLVVTSTNYGPGNIPIRLGMKRGKVVITKVEAGSQVAVTGLRKGAVLLKIDGNSIRSVRAAKRYLTGRAGSVVMIEVLQDGEPLSVVVQRSQGL